MPKSRIYELITSHLLRQSTNESFWIRFTCCPNFNVSSFLMEGDIQIFKLVILLTLSSLVIFLTWSSSQLIVIFLTLSKSQMTHLYYIGQAIGVLLVWARHWAAKTIQNLSVWQQIEEPHIDLSQVIFNDSVSGIKNWLPQLTNRL